MLSFGLMASLLTPDESEEYFHELEAHLEPYMNENRVLKLRCGRCNRVLGEVMPHVDGRQVSLNVIEDAESLYRRPPNWPNGIPPYNPRQTVTYEFQATKTSFADVCDRIVIRCHPRCGAVWTLTMRRLVDSYAAVCKRGGLTLLLGVDTA